MAELQLGEAIALGLLHGPAELLPISSSGHVTVVPWLLGWEYPDVDAELRKSFEVMLHAGTAAALIFALRSEVADSLRTGTPRLAILIGLSFMPPAAAGYAFEGPIERHLGRPGPVAAALAAGGLALAWADRSPSRRDSAEATGADALWLGVAQACALVPGVSRNGATLTAARRRGFTRASAQLLSRHVALPIIAAATARRLARLHAREVPPAARKPLAGGAAASFASTLAAVRAARRIGPDRTLLPYAAYRLAVSGLIAARLARLRSARSSTMGP